MDKEIKMNLLKAQQGELDAVPMYLKLSEIAKDEELKAAFKQLAADEGRHASVFYNLTGEKLKPKKLKSIMLPVMQKCMGWKKLLKTMSDGEYAAFKVYEPVIKMFPEVEVVRNDEKRHGDILLKLSEKMNK